MSTKVFSNDVSTEKELIITPGAPIENSSRVITSDVSDEAIKKGNLFSKEIEQNYLSDFEKPIDKKAHVSTFIVIDDIVYMSYYANTKEPEEDPKNQTARFVYAPVDDIENKTFIDLQTTGDVVGGKIIDMVYDTILMQKDSNTIYIMWTARTEENYYRFYCPFYISDKRLGDIGVNRFKVGNSVNDFSVSGIKMHLLKMKFHAKKCIPISVLCKSSQAEKKMVKHIITQVHTAEILLVL